MKIDKLLCLDRLSIACTLGSFICLSFISSKWITIGKSTSYSWVCSYFSIDFDVSMSVCDFSKCLWLTISSIELPKSGSLKMS